MSLLLLPLLPLLLQHGAMRPAFCLAGKMPLSWLCLWWGWREI